jgi:hypothetical protein
MKASRKGPFRLSIRTWDVYTTSGIRFVPLTLYGKGGRSLTSARKLNVHVSGIDVGLYAASNEIAIDFIFIRILGGSYIVRPADEFEEPAKDSESP